MPSTHLPVPVSLQGLSPLLFRKRQFLQTWREVCERELGPSFEFETKDFDGVFERELTRLSDTTPAEWSEAAGAAFRATAEAFAQRGIPLSSLLAISACAGRAATQTLGDELTADTLRALSELEVARATAYSGAYRTLTPASRSRCGPPLVSLRRSPSNENGESEEYGVIGQSDVMRRVRGAIFVASRGPKQNLLVLGEKGSGKELCARAIHDAAGGERSQFIRVSCAGLPNHLVETELFGHAENGSPAYAGSFRSAQGGTLFFDELADVPPEIQAKLERVLDERRVTPIGSNEPLPVDVRVIAATRHDPAELVARGHLRTDLYQSLQGFTLKLPPLRERRKDIAQLVEHFLRTFCHRRCGCIWGVSQRALDTLVAAEWPGNVRELRNAIEHAVGTGESGVIEVGDLPEYLQGLAQPDDARRSRSEPGDLPSLEDAESQLIRATLEHFRGNKVRAALSLGISRHKLYDRLRKLGIH
jgi:DNA-binding NtrC family response regulator